MVAKSEIKDRLATFVNANFVKDSGKAINDNTSFLDDGIIDSTGVLELVSFLEESFSFRIEDEEIMPDNLDSINKLLVFVEKKLDSGNPT